MPIHKLVIQQTILVEDDSLDIARTNVGQLFEDLRNAVDESIQDVSHGTCSTFSFESAETLDPADVPTELDEIDRPEDFFE